MSQSWFSVWFERAKGQSRFVNHVLTLMTGAVVAQVISIFTAPALTRLYTPDEFGVFALYMSVANVFAVIITGRYQLAIMLPDNDDEAINILALSVLIVFFASLTLATIVLFFGEFIQDVIPVKVSSFAVFNFPVVIFFTGVYQIEVAWLNRKQNYKVVSLGKINQSGFNASTAVALGVIGWGAMGLIVGDFVGAIAAVATGFVKVKSEVRHLIGSISFADMRRVGLKYSIFPTINMLHALGDMAQASGVIFVISTGFGAGILGFYAFGLRVLRAPMGIIGNSIAQVFYHRLIIDYNKKQSIKPVLVLMLKRLFIVAAVPFLLIFIFCNSIFSLIFGLNWSEAGVYVQILCPWLYLNFVASTVSQVPMIVGKQKEVFLISLIGNLIMLSIFIIGAYFEMNFRWVLVCVSFFMSVYTALIIIWTLKISDELSRKN